MGVGPPTHTGKARGRIIESRRGKTAKQGNNNCGGGVCVCVCVCVRRGVGRGNEEPRDRRPPPLQNVITPNWLLDGQSITQNARRVKLGRRKRNNLATTKATGNGIREREREKKRERKTERERQRHTHTHTHIFTLHWAIGTQRRCDFSNDFATNDLGGLSGNELLSRQKKFELNMKNMDGTGSLWVFTVSERDRQTDRQTDTMSSLWDHLYQRKTK